MDSSWLRITVAYCPPGGEDVSEVRVPLGATVRDAIDAAQVRARRPELQDAMDTGIWGRRCSLDQLIADGDRVEIYRPLTIDPMEGRRLRGARRAAPSSLRAPTGGGRAATGGEHVPADLRRKRGVKN